METSNEINVNKWSTQSIINYVSNVVSPWWKFNMDDIYGDRGGIPYPAIEELTHLYFKADSKIQKQQTKEECDLMLEQLKQLNIGQVEIVKFGGIGKFISIELTCKVLVIQQHKYSQFVNANQEKINQMHQFVDKQVPREFIGYYLFFKQI
jgi:hypothetical protein